jgi:hypothetical protein
MQPPYSLTKETILSLTCLSSVRLSTPAAWMTTTCLKSSLPLPKGKQINYLLPRWSLALPYRAVVLCYVLGEAVGRRSAAAFPAYHIPVGRCHVQPLGCWVEHHPSTNLRPGGEPL